MDPDNKVQTFAWFAFWAMLVYVVLAEIVKRLHIIY